MSSLATALITFEEFVKLPDPVNAKRYELHDGEVVLVPPARPLHIALQLRIVELLGSIRAFDLVATVEFPYRPAPNYQFWYADVAVLPHNISDEMATWEEYKPYAPLLVVVVLSKSNTEEKINKQRIASMSNGTQEFWVVDADKETVQVTTSLGVQLFGHGNSIEVLGLGVRIEVDAIFGDMLNP